MSLESLIDDSGQQCSILAEAPDRRTPAQTAMGGADRSDGVWLGVADGVACLVRPIASDLDYDRNDARASVMRARIYFTGDILDLVPSGLTTRQRIVVTQSPDPALLGTYAIQGVINPNSMGRIFQADCERIRTP